MFAEMLMCLAQRNFIHFSKYYYSLITGWKVHAYQFREVAISFQQFYIHLNPLRFLLYVKGDARRIFVHMNWHIWVDWLQPIAKACIYMFLANTLLKFFEFTETAIDWKISFLYCNLFLNLIFIIPSTSRSCACIVGST